MVTAFVKKSCSKPYWSKLYKPDSDWFKVLKIAKTPSFLRKCDVLRLIEFSSIFSNTNKRFIPWLSYWRNTSTIGTIIFEQCEKLLVVNIIPLIFGYLWKFYLFFPQFFMSANLNQFNKNISIRWWYIYFVLWTEKYVNLRKGRLKCFCNTFI